MGLGSLSGVLEEIRITGLGVIEDATLELVDGFTVVTGETGAGKTMVVAGLGLLFGGRADAGRVRRGTGRALVEGRLRFEPDDPAQKLVLDRVAEAGAAPDEDGTLLLARSVAAEGRSRAHVGGRTVPVSLLGELAEQMLAVHGQSDQLRLLSAAEQRGALDRYAGEEVAHLRETCKQQHQAWRQAVTELADRTTRAHERAQEADALRFGLSEIEAVNPLPGEDEELKAESRRLEHAEELRIAAYTAHQALAGDPTADLESADVAALLGVVRRSLSAVAGHDAVLADAARRADELAALCGELGTELASYTENLDADPARLAAVHERRAQLAALTRKYADSIDGVLAWAEQAAGKLADLDTSEEALDALRARRDELAAELATTAAALSRARQAAATRFGEQVTAELTGLAMPHARVIAAVSQKEVAEGAQSVVIDGRRLAVTGDGVDEVELRLASHPGAPELALHRGASGGELSRVMLAIEVVFAGAGGPPTMVFDEVDAGVGGRAAVEIGKRLARLARTHQVLVVTHLPQVAAFADHHVVVVKDSDGSVTTSGLQSLTADERPRELARMLAGLDDSDLATAHAEELLAVAKAEKDAAA
ncbi:DNA repair protein RecN [Cryptosporangium japonicum]|uniref:DNA repair protein RecN n=1 Tax=Cryptosporangium japonicum TaxID=80872 RepID=A0ABP3EWF8_9ACTN